MVKLITIIILLGVSIGAFAKYVRPTYDNAMQTKANVARFDDALTKTMNIRRVRTSLSSRFQEFPESKIARLQKMLPDHVDNVRLVLDMDGVASQYGMRLQNVTIQSSKKSASGGDATNGIPSSLEINTNSDQPYKSLVLQFEVEATYADFLSFLHDIESSLRIVDVEKLSMEQLNTGKEGSMDEPRYKYKLSLRTYWLK